MSEIKLAFWNLQNLFDTNLSDIATDFEYTPSEGWDAEAFNNKISNLAQVINLMHNGAGPDLLGICEIENKEVVLKLLEACNRDDYEVAHIESNDIRGIDTTLIYSKKVFEIIETPIAHNVHLRYPTRDIFQVNLRVKENNSEIVVLVNHWPSRWRGEYLTEPYRLAAANSCGTIADRVLKYTKKAYLLMEDTEKTNKKVNERWNRNILILGDFNDEPFNKSIMTELKASSGVDKLEEKIKKSGDRLFTPTPESYLKKEAYFYNCMWKFLDKPDTGTHFYSESTNTMSVLDQFIISRGLYYGFQNLKFLTDSVNIFRPKIMISSGKERPKKFNVKTKKGYSDHFPITAKMEIL